MIAVVVTGALGVVSSVLQLGIVDKAKDFLDGTASEDEFEDAFNAVNAVSSVSGLAQIAAVVFSIIWLQRVLSNHRRVLRQTTWGPGWAIGGWFLPPFLFVIPLLTIREAWQASSPDVPAGDQSWKQSPTSPWVWIWWALFGLVPLVFIPLTLSRFDTFSTDTEDLADFVKDSSAINVASSIVSLAAAVAWAFLVRELTARHERLLGHAS
jgi:hypothetical protein